jgi:hypothetical protein
MVALIVLILLVLSWSDWPGAPLIVRVAGDL